MRQHDLDLLPESMRVKSQQRAAARRNVTMALSAAAAMVLLTTHARVVRGSAEHELRLLRNEVKVLERHEREVQRLEAELDLVRRRASRQRVVETPLPISRIIAQVVQAMPDSLTLDRLDVNAEQVRRQRTGGGVGTSGAKGVVDAGPRVLVAEVAGFARDDLDIARFVSNLDGTEPFAEVSLDYSRQRQVREVPAREFRLSFSIDFDAPWTLQDDPGAVRDRSVSHAD